jgi:hypothetical protein
MATGALLDPSRALLIVVLLRIRLTAFLLLKRALSRASGNEGVPRQMDIGWKRYLTEEKH